VTLTHLEIFQRYVHAGAISRDADAVAELFTEDGVFEAPLVPAGHPLPRRLVGREAIRTGIAAYHRDGAPTGVVNTAASRFVLHDTVDPDVFIAEIDTVLDTADGPRTMSLVQIVRVRDDKIALLRDYFAA
jgi:ketosteroid isomerase-like protein